MGGCEKSQYLQVTIKFTLRGRVKSVNCTLDEKAVTTGCWLVPGPMVVTGSEGSSIVLWEVVKRADAYR